jgi:hypothetical protein
LFCNRLFGVVEMAKADKAIESHQLFRGEEGLIASKVASKNYLVLAQMMYEMQGAGPCLPL